MATLTVTPITRAGIDLLGVAATGGGDQFTNTGKEVLLVTNADATSKTVTLATAATVDGLAVADRSVAVPSGKTYAIGPFPRYVYNDASAYVQVTYSAVTSVTVKVVSLVAESA